MFADRLVKRPLSSLRAGSPALWPAWVSDRPSSSSCRVHLLATPFSCFFLRTGKTLLARALACNLNATFLKVRARGCEIGGCQHEAGVYPRAQVVASAIVDKYIGESSRVIREMFGYAKDHQPCVIFMDEIDAIGGKRYGDGTSAGAP